METELTLSQSGSLPNTERHSLVLGRWLASLVSPQSIRAYRVDLVQACAFFDAFGLDLFEVHRSEIDAWRASLVQRGFKSTTIARKLAGLSSFYDFAATEDRIELNPVTQVRRPRVDSTVSTGRGLTRSEVRDLLKAASDHSPRGGALVTLLYYTGARISEALGANSEDLSYDQGLRVLTVQRKGGHEAKLVLPPQVLTALTTYQGHTVALGQQVALTDQKQTPLFTTRSGTRWGASAAAQTISRIARNAGIHGKVSPHTLRHTHITHALDAGAPLHDVQDSVGHRSPTTTQRYNHARHRLEKSTALVLSRL